MSKNISKMHPSLQFLSTRQMIADAQNSSVTEKPNHHHLSCHFPGVPGPAGFPRFLPSFVSEENLQG